MQDLAEKAKELINQHLLTTTLSTIDRNCNIDVSIASVILMTDPETIKVAQLSKQKAYENLRATRKGVFMVVVPTVDSMKTDSICIAVELVKEETEGEEFDTMQYFINEAYGGIEIKNLLTFRITEIKLAMDL